VHAAPSTHEQQSRSMQEWLYPHVLVTPHTRTGRVDELLLLGEVDLRRAARAATSRNVSQKASARVPGPILTPFRPSGSDRAKGSLRRSQRHLCASCAALLVFCCWLFRRRGRTRKSPSLRHLHLFIAQIDRRASARIPRICSSTYMYAGSGETAAQGDQKNHGRDGPDELRLGYQQSQSVEREGGRSLYR